MWRKVRCGACGHMGVGGRKFVGAWTKVRRCVEEGALRWERAYGCGKAKVRRRGGGGAKMCGGSCAGVGALVWLGEG